MSNNKYIEQVEKDQLRKDIPEFSQGDTVVVQVRVLEGSRERLQPFEGIVISIKKRVKPKTDVKFAYNILKFLNRIN